MLRGFANAEKNIWTQEKVRREDLNSFYLLPDRIPVIKWSGSSLVRVRRRGQVRSADKILVGKTKGNKIPGKT